MEKINSNNSNEFKGININFHKDKVFNIPSNCKWISLDFFKLIFTDEILENVVIMIMLLNKKELEKQNQDIETQEEYMEECEKNKNK